MKITFVLPSGGLSGGVRVVATYAARLAARGHAVTVVAGPPPRSTLRDRFRHLARHREWPRQRPSQSHLDNLEGVHRVHLSQHRPVVASDVPDADVIVATWWETAEWIADFPAAKGRKFHLMQDYEVFPYTPEDRVKAVYKLPFSRIAVSRWIADMVGDAKAAVVPNSVDQRLFNSPPRSKQPTFSMGVLYSTTPRKNSRLALDAIALADIPGARVLCFSDHPPPEGMIVPRNFTCHVRPSAAEIAAIYASCDVWLFTSTSEGFGLPILEAMACRTPVIATAAGAAPDLIDGRNGVLVESDVDRIAEQIVRFSEMSDADWRMASEAAYRTATSYTWNDAVDRLEKALA